MWAIRMRALFLPCAKPLWITDNTSLLFFLMRMGGGFIFVRLFNGSGEGGGGVVGRFESGGTIIKL